METSSFWRKMRPLNRRMVRNYLRGIGPKKLVLLLTTTGRRTGIPRVTPLQYEISGSRLYVASARGPGADWIRNILADPRVEVQIGERRCAAEAEVITKPDDIADFLEMRLQRHPVMLRLVMCLFEGLPWRFTRVDLEAFAAKKTLVSIPYETGGKDGQDRS